MESAHRLHTSHTQVHCGHVSSLRYLWMLIHHLYMQSLTSGLRRAQDHLRPGLRMVSLMALLCRSHSFVPQRLIPPQVAVMARPTSKRQDHRLQGLLLVSTVSYGGAAHRDLSLNNDLDAGYRSNGLNAHSQTTALIPPIDTGALPDVGNAAAATDSRPNSPNRSWWETVMLSSPESEYMSEWDA